MKTIKKLTDRIYSSFAFLMVFAMLCLTVPALAQDEEKTTKADKPARPAFSSAWWFDGQTNEVYNKNTLEFSMNHRFGVINSGNNDLFGIYGASNIRLGLAYVPIEKLQIGFGYTKNKRILDLTAKYAILKQTRSNSMPISLTYYGNMGIELRKDENNEIYLNTSDRYNYFNQLIIAKRFSSKFSAMIGGSYTHYNAVKWEQQTDGSWQHMENDTWGLNLGVRYKIASQTSIMLGYDQPLTEHPINQPKASINLGIEIATSSHAFQIILTNNSGIQPQENYMFNQNDFSEGEWLIGFNITRLRSF
ncbi:MAG: hypothetical protein DRI71_03030 [Bacteroidetes bacterium]|nr:MAG: hypothetical protein DRI71_03030 [Bacteroidota bacterium]